MKKTSLYSRIRQGRSRLDGTPGRYYVRLWLRDALSAHKARAYDLPLETNSDAVAVDRAAFLVRSLMRAGAEVLGDVSDLLALSLPERPKKRRRQKPDTP